MSCVVSRRSGWRDRRRSGEATGSAATAKTLFEAPGPLCRFTRTHRVAIAETFGFALAYGETREAVRGYPCVVRSVAKARKAMVRVS
jgi:hypothetical protein